MNNIKKWDDESNSMATYKRAVFNNFIQYNDSGFAANVTSMYGINGRFEKKMKKDVDKYVKKWKRPTAFNEMPSLWGPTGKPTPRGIYQGGTNNCWFISAAAALAEVPERIFKTIESKD